MTIKAEIIKDSISPEDIRLTTFRLRYPKFIHGEAKTHRQIRIADKAYELLEEIGFMDDPNLSRNASSSRAIPVERLVKDVMDDPAIPIHWGKNQKGMQADEECDALVTLPFGGDSIDNEGAWLYARDNAINIAQAFSNAGYHKQIVNRLLEPFCHINVVVTATQWNNFFALRCHPDAQPEMRMLAEAMRDAMKNSIPLKLGYGEWHLPFIEDEDRKHHEGTLIKISAARCARVSYLTQEGKPSNAEEDIALHDRLVRDNIIHASPCEHQATPDRPNVFQGPEKGAKPVYPIEWANDHLHGNFDGWIQYRKMIPGECK